MNKFNKFIILTGLLFSFSIANAEIKEVESLDAISEQILGNNSTKTKKEKVRETEKKEVVKNETKKEAEIKSEKETPTTEETVVNDILDETATRVINKSEIVDFYDLKCTLKEN